MTDSDPHPMPALDSTSLQSPFFLPLVGPGTPPETSPQPIVSQRDPLGLLDKPRIPSPRTAQIIERRARLHKEYRPASKELEEAGSLPGGKPIGSVLELNCYGRLMPKPREWFYPEVSTVGLEMRCQDGPWEEQYDRSVPLPPIPGKEAKALPSPRSRLR